MTGGDGGHNIVRSVIDTRHGTAGHTYYTRSRSGGARRNVRQTWYRLITDDLADH